MEVERRMEWKSAEGGGGGGGRTTTFLNSCFKQLLTPHYFLAGCVFDTFLCLFSAFPHSLNVI